MLSQFAGYDICMYRRSNTNDYVVVCSNCNFVTETYWEAQYFHDPKTATKHLEEHKEKGDRVPEKAFEELRKDIKKKSITY